MDLGINLVMQRSRKKPNKDRNEIEIRKREDQTHRTESIYLA